jgi:hypothetical protein
MPTIGPARRAAASARGTNAQSTPAVGLSASCQQPSRMLLCRISACLEAEPIYETSSLAIGAAQYHHLSQPLRLPQLYLAAEATWPLPP